MFLDERRLEALVRDARRIAVVGLSPRPERPSYQVARDLQRVGFTIVPVNPCGGVILGEPGYPNLETAAGAAGPIDLGDVFRRSGFVPELLSVLLQIPAPLLLRSARVRP